MTSTRDALSARVADLCDLHARHNGIDLAAALERKWFAHLRLRPQTG